MKKIFFFVLLLSFPTKSFGTTAPDLESRIKIDGNAAEYTPDEWILGETAFWGESAGDSRWGSENDIHGIAVTWDNNYLYVAVTCLAADTRLFSFIEFAAGGINDMTGAGPLRRQLFFHGLSPNLVVSACRSDPRAVAGLVSSSSPLAYVDDEDFNGRFYQPRTGAGALEIALPWKLVKLEGGAFKLLAVISGEEGTGAGDAAPDPTAALQNDPHAPAHLNNALVVVVDGDGDGVPDTGVSPRAAASLVTPQSAVTSGAAEIELRTNTKTLFPDQGQKIEISIRAGDVSEPVLLYVTCEVFSAAGRRVAVLVRDEPRMFFRGADTQVDHWDGRDTGGEVVPGGVYVINASAGTGPGTARKFVRKTVAVVR